ncbi:peptidase M16 [Amylibacter marinus]|uniref:Peptidase M16 n=1 Tax=Amylibacter marinus TaxID=1475483 RepID=A0ABQ5VWU3_9RHOB|nr:pitrilysin family protein [Amylibacter marinus]GLQ35767.1 peptidase M16 [Amylibacter marinus]
MIAKLAKLITACCLCGTSALALGEVSTFELDNGLEIVVIEDHRAPVVTHMLWYRVGAADEPAGKSGIAHFLEHLLFKGTDDLAPGEFSEIVSANGGSENAFTSFDYTGYFQRVSADRLPLMMKIESDRMQNLNLTEEEVLPERDVIIEERNSRTENNPSALFSEHRSALMYANHPYGTPVIGWMHEIENLTREDALDFYKKYYAPNNAILIVAGDVEPENVLALAQEHYGPRIPSDAITKRVRPQEPPKRAPIHTIFEDPRVGQPYVIREYLSANRKSGDQTEAAALRVFAELLGGSGVTSFLGQKLQLEQKVAINQAAWHSGMSYDRDGFGLYAVPAAGVSLQDLEEALDAALAEFLVQGVDVEHLARIKTQMKAAEIYALDNQSDVARRYGEALTSGLTVQDVQEWPALLAAVTAEDVMQAARTVLNENASVTGWFRAPQETK